MLAGDVVPRAPGALGRSDSNDAKRRMIRGVCQLSFQCLEATSHHVRLGDAKLSGQLRQPAALNSVEIDLHRLPDPLSLSVMFISHDIMICDHDTLVKVGLNAASFSPDRVAAVVQAMHDTHIPAVSRTTEVNLRTHPQVPATGGIFEGFAIELADRDAKSHVSEKLTSLVGPEWVVRKFGNRETDFEITPSKAPLSAKDGWNGAYALRTVPGVAYAEPFFSVSVSDNPKWLAKAGGAGVSPELPDEAEHLPESRSPEWSLDAIRAKEAWKKFFPDATKLPGQGVVIGHPDTGYQDHPELEGRIAGTKGYDFVYDDPDAHDDLERPRSTPVPNPGHGTGTASIIVSPDGGRQKYPGDGWVTGVAPGAEIIPLRTAYSVVLWSTRNLARAIEYATTQGAHVISISMGGLFSWRLRRAVLFAESNGVIICAAAGNYAPFVTWPGVYDEVIACAASNARGGAWRYSCNGRAVDVTAPGESVWRATVKKETDGMRYDVVRGSGTSFATTTTVGVAAMWLSHHGRDALIARYGKENVPRVFSQVLRENCVSFPGWKKGKFGAGLIDAFRTLDAPLPDPATIGGTAKEKRTDEHPDIDRGGLRTFLHLFDMEGAEPELSRALAALLSIPEHELEPTLHETGQELAFHLATDPACYRLFTRVLRGDAALDELRESLVSRASTPLEMQLTRSTQARAGVTMSGHSPAPHL